MTAEKEDTRYGRQTPTKSFVLEYSETKGPEAVALYNKSSRKAMQWQSQLIYDIMAVNADGLWTHTSFGWSVPRRNGKSEILIMREIWGLLHGEKILHTAHLAQTAHATFERLCRILTDAGYDEKKHFQSYRRLGAERIEMAPQIGGSEISFRTRTARGALGEGFDLLVVDEAQEYQSDQETALKYVISDSKNPQLLMCGTPPTTVSAGTVFPEYRKSTLAGELEDCGWAEWSVDKLTDPRDAESWYETNPSMGTILTERKIRAEIRGDSTDFNIQRLGLWLGYSQKSAISQEEWEHLAVKEELRIQRKLFIGIKFGHDGTNTAVSVAAKTADGRIFVEGIDCRPMRSGVAWIIPYLENPHVQQVVIDGQNGQQILAEAMKKCGLSSPVLPTVKEVISAGAKFENAVFAGKICHMNQPALTQSVSNCEHRPIGSGGGFGYRSIREGVEAALLESAVLAAWACGESKERKTQKITY